MSSYILKGILHNFYFILFLHLLFKIIIIIIFYSFFKLLTHKIFTCHTISETSHSNTRTQSRSSLYAEYAGCIGPPKHQGAPLLSKVF